LADRWERRTAELNWRGSFPEPHRSLLVSGGEKRGRKKEHFTRRKDYEKAIHLVLKKGRLRGTNLYRKAKRESALLYIPLGKKSKGMSILEAKRVQRTQTQGGRRGKFSEFRKRD